eukprot:364503-Chlamydomonas_euryale.AAC.15
MEPRYACLPKAVPPPAHGRHRHDRKFRATVVKEAERLHARAHMSDVPQSLESEDNFWTNPRYCTLPEAGTQNIPSSPKAQYRDLCHPPDGDGWSQGVKQLPVWSLPGSRQLEQVCACWVACGADTLHVADVELARQRAAGAGVCMLGCVWGRHPARCNACIGKSWTSSMEGS